MRLTVRRIFCGEHSGINDGVLAGLGNLAAVFHRDIVPGDVAAGGGASVAGNSVVKLPGLLPIHVGQRQRPPAVCDGLGDQGGVGVGQVGIGAAGRYRPTAGFVTSRLHGDLGVVGFQNAGVAVLGGDFTLRLQRLDDLAHILGAALQRDNLDVVLGVRLAQVVLQNVQQRIVTALPVKVPGGDGGGVVAGGQVIHLLQPDHAVLLARPHLCGVEDGGGRCALRRFRTPCLRRQRRTGQGGEGQQERGGNRK